MPTTAEKMSDGTVNSETETSKPATPGLDGKPERKASELDSFKSPEGTSGPSSGKLPSSGGKKAGTKKPIGRPPKNLAGFSKAKIDEVENDPEIEAARAEFEEVLVELLVATTEGIAESRFTLLCKKFPQAEARGLAEKALLTDKEKKYFGGVAIRLWRKYLGDKYLFTDESIASVYVIKYAMRNFEGYNQARKIEAELKLENAKKPDKRTGIQRQTDPHSGSERNGKDDVDLPSRLQPPGPAGPGL